MAITRFSQCDPALSSARPNLESLKFEFQDRQTLEDERDTIKSLSDLELLARKQETEKLIHELRVRLSVCEIDYRRRITEAAEKKSRELEKADQNWNVHALNFQRTAQKVYETLLHSGVPVAEAKARVAKMLKLVE
jgi:hypothetical protein